LIFDEFFPPALVSISRRPPAFYVATPGLREVRVYDVEGILNRILRINLPLEPVTDEMEKAFRERVEGSGTSQGASLPSVRVLVDEIEIPNQDFPYSDLVVDSEGTLWLLRHDPLAERGDFQWTKRWRKTEGIAEYHVVDQTEGWLGKVSIPREAGVIREIGSDYVLTVRTDEFDVPYVRVYRLRKRR